MDSFEISMDTTNVTKIKINTGNSEPVLLKPYPIAIKHYDKVKDEIDKFSDIIVIHSSQ